METHGLLTKNKWFESISSETYSKIAHEATNFINRESFGASSKYIKKWGHSLKHCSRLFEYPLVLDNINNMKLGKSKILDYGSGFTFFPFMLGQLDFEVHAADIDPLIKTCFEKSTSQYKPVFNLSKNGQLEFYNDNFFDFIYSISVLEHSPVESYEHIFGELYRVINVNGKMLITFDISLDGKSSINLENLKVFLKSIDKNFKVVNESRNTSEIFENLIHGYKLNSELYATTDFFNIHFPSLSAWGGPTWRSRYGINSKLKVQKEPFFSSLLFAWILLEPKK
jgi:2-polyprenyl-3-methyl-5-hydroxy-6-metoxy-1,4-benzoquinol methylase